MTTLVAAGATDVGMVRSSNEDEYLVAEPLYAVADGMGGHAAGEVASAAAVEALQAAFHANPSADGLVDAVKSANRAVWDQSQEHAEHRGMGTTLTALALISDDEGQGEILAIAHVGDSRAYLLRDGELIQVTDDHSVPEELLRAGRISPEEAANDPRRHVLTRVLGVDAEVAVDTHEVVPFKGDRILLASDGLFGEVSDEDIASVLRRRSDPKRVARELVSMAKEAGGADNITVVVIDVTDDDDRAAKASAGVEPEALSSRPWADRLPASAPAPGTDGQLERGQVPRAVLTQERPLTPGAQPAAADAAQPAKRPRRVSLATVAFLVVLALVLGLAAAAIVFTARGSYFVGLQGEDVVIFKGRPGGLLGFQPTFEERTDIRLADVLASRAEDLRRGKQVSSLGAARAYVRDIAEEGAKASAATLPPATLPPSTTVP